MSNIDPFVEIKLFLNGENITVQYNLDPQFSAPGPYLFELVALNDPTFNEELYSIASTEFFIVDDKRVRQNALRSFAYKLRLTDGANNRYYSRWFGWHSSDNVTRHKYLIASDICRREHVRFNYVGLYGYLLKRRNYVEQPDIADTDPITGEPLIDNSVSFGVGAVGGYYSPVLMRFSVENHLEKTDYAEDGRGSQTSVITKIRCAGFPYVEQHDLVAMMDGTRHTVSDIQPIYFPGTTQMIVQNVTLRLIPMTDTVYDISIPAFPNE